MLDTTSTFRAINAQYMNTQYPRHQEHEEQCILTLIGSDSVIILIYVFISQYGSLFRSQDSGLLSDLCSLVIYCSHMR